MFHSRCKTTILFLICELLLLLQNVSSFGTITLRRSSYTGITTRRGNRHDCTLCFATKGRSKNEEKKGGFGFSNNNIGKTAVPKKKAASQENVTKRIQKIYGGTTPQEIAIGTQRIIDESFQKLPSHLQVATQLYQKIQQWNQHVATMSILQQASIPLSDIHGAQAAQNELDRICIEHSITAIDLHNIFQKITWDASAYAKAARSMTGTMSSEITERIDRACTIVEETIQQSLHPYPRCLDVGCGYGVLVPNLIQAGQLRYDQIYGIDLSPEMISIAKELHSPQCTFEVADFINEYNGPTTTTTTTTRTLKNNNNIHNNDDGKFDSIIFCSSLHDLPDPILALQKATSLLRLNGTIVIVHAQGAGHVKKQVETNPVLVKRQLPNTQELQQLVVTMKESIATNVVLVIEPALPNTPQDVSDGYLAVLRRVQ